MIAADWQLIAEGGANIVFAYTGSDPSYINKALRIRKRLLSSTTAARPDQSTDPAVAFSAHVVSRLLPVEAVTELREVSVSTAFLQDLADRVESSRLPARRAVDVIDTTRTAAVLTEDLTAKKPPLGSARLLAVEIKVRTHL